MKSKLVIVVGFLIVAAVAVTSGRDRAAPVVTQSRDPAPPTIPEPVDLRVLYSPEKEDWIESVAIEFRRIEPGINLTLVPMESLHAAEAILSGLERPTLWSPTDSVAIEWLEGRWRERHESELFIRDGELSPRPLVLSPLVFVIWSDRAQVLAGQQRPSWQAIRRVLTAKKGWSAFGGHREWGAIKIGHADPLRSSSGLGTLYLIANDFFGGSRPLRVSDLEHEGFESFVRPIERSVPGGLSTGEFVTEMVRFGPSRFDLGITYENLAIAQMENAEGRWGPLKVYYPAPTIWGDHPAAVLATSWVTAEMRQAARKWLMYLRSRTVQRTALAFGFRPADVGVPVVSTDLRNPFPRLAPYGIKVELPTGAALPTPEVTAKLLDLSRKCAATPR